MDRRFFSRLGFGLLTGAATFAATRAAADETKPDVTAHRLVIQVSTEDRKVQQLALGNAANYAEYYKARSEPYSLEIVAFGPGYSMMRADMSMVKGTIEELQRSLGAAVTFSACQNSRRFIAESEGKKPEDIAQLPGVMDTPAGIVRVAELQARGWAYARP